MKKVIRHIITVASVVVIGAGTIIGNLVAMTFEPQITSFLVPPITKGDQEIKMSREKGQALSKQIVQEGTVMVKNEDNCLPLDKNNEKE